MTIHKGRSSPLVQTLTINGHSNGHGSTNAGVDDQSLRQRTVSRDLELGSKYRPPAHLLKPHGSRFASLIQSRHARLRRQIAVWSRSPVFRVSLACGISTALLLLAFVVFTLTAPSHTVPKQVVDLLHIITDKTASFTSQSTAIVADKFDSHSQTKAADKSASSEIEMEIDLSSDLSFALPRYTSSSSSSSSTVSNLYLTAWPNHGAGVGHQFGEWLNGPYMSLTHKITFVHTPFLHVSAKWTDFLGFGVNELNQTQLHLQYGEANVKEIVAQDLKRDQLDSWIDNQVAHFTANPPQSTQAVLLRSYRIDSPREVACHPELNLWLRRKYCAARIKSAESTGPNLYLNDRHAHRFVVALHLRCGDSCFHPFRATSFSSLQTTVSLLVDGLIHKHKHVKALGDLSFHIFSQPPSNASTVAGADAHFEPLIRFIRSATDRQAQVNTHFDLSAHSTLHHLVMSDLLIGATSSFSWLGGLLQNGAVIGPPRMWPCQNKIDYKQATGEFDVTQMIKAVREAHKTQPKFNNMKDCHQLRPIPAQEAQPIAASVTAAHAPQPTVATPAKPSAAPTPAADAPASAP